MKSYWRSLQLSLFICSVIMINISIENDSISTLAETERSVWYIAVQSAIGGDGSVQNPFNSIQDGIDTAHAGDIVQVGAGTYYENITMKSGVEILGAGAGASIINGGGNGSVVIANNVDSEAKLEGFTITNGSGTIVSSLKCGGGAYLAYSNPIIKECRFSGNYADHAGGGICNYESAPTLIECVFIDNRAMVGGGLSNISSRTIVKDCHFNQNSADYGGGLMEIGSDTLVHGSWFYRNTAEYGAGICSTANFSTITNCLLLDNSADYGGAVFCTSASYAAIINCSFTQNTALQGKALGCDSLDEIGSNKVEIVNSILWNGGDEVWNRDNSLVTITYSDVQGGYTGEGNINKDPLFNDPNNQDLHLGAPSPCIDAGNNSRVPTELIQDYDGDNRIIDGNEDEIATVDIGADEFVSVDVPGDANGDGVVDGQDMIAISKNILGIVPIIPRADCNLDQVVNGQDLICIKKKIISIGD
ncbi:MAG: DUF1565 domain-containing protein [Chloroflexota bacterium]|nr:DUF1565 domain-containing protein [Chloroflexota bacterium]